MLRLTKFLENKHNDCSFIRPKVDNHDPPLKAKVPRSWLPRKSVGFPECHCLKLPKGVIN